jgi:hypothetical protein
MVEKFLLRHIRQRSSPATFASCPFYTDNEI